MILYTTHFTNLSFWQLRKKLFEIIGYKDQESSGSRSRPDFQNESERFRVELRNANFLNPSRSNPIFGSLDGSCRLSEGMKSFSVTAQAYRINYIKDKLIHQELLVPFLSLLKKKRNNQKKVQ